MPAGHDDNDVHFHIWGEKLVISMPQERAERAKYLIRLILREPFTKRPYKELAFIMVGSALAGVAVWLTVALLGIGTVLLVTFIGLAVIGLAVRAARGFGGWQRGLARSLLNEQIENPAAFTHRPGFFGWLQMAMRDRTGWRAFAYFLLKIPFSIFAIYAAASLWWDAFVCITRPLLFNGGGSPIGGLIPNIFFAGHSLQTGGFLRGVGVFVLGIVFFFAAPWPIRGLVYIDRLMMQTMLSPDSVAQRMRSLEQARTQTVDSAAATLRRIERDLHDGTQAQLVALAMQLGMAKEKLETSDDVDLDRVRQLVDAAHQGAKEAIVELRDLARGIHPPALDIGLEGALDTLAARSTTPTECIITLHDRPTPAIESIAYFCIAELLANVAQHAQASKATIQGTQFGSWLRLVVRDDGVGGALPAERGTSSSGLAGLTERVQSVDGRLYIASPVGGPTVVTVDLPLHA
jgi:signal transduction histidine kinase